MITYSTITPLLYHNLGGLSRGFLHFFSSLRRWVSGSDRQIHQPSAGSDFGGTPCAPLPLTPIVYHRLHQKSTGNIAQIREKMRPDVCAICELIFFEQRDIMEILPGAFDLGQPNIIIECLIKYSKFLHSRKFE